MKTPTHSETTLGELITGHAIRDAVHVACAPMTADCDLAPGEHVGIVCEGFAGKCEPFVGIVDPFLKSEVRVGQIFWLVLYPKTVTSLKHVWEHPAFQDAPKDSKLAEQWVTEFAARWGYSFDDFMEGARGYYANGTELDDDFKQLDVSDEDWNTFWEHFHTLTGQSIVGREKEFVRCCPN